MPLNIFHLNGIWTVVMIWAVFLALLPFISYIRNYLESMMVEAPTIKNKRLKFCRIYFVKLKFSHHQRLVKNQALQKGWQVFPYQKGKLFFKKIATSNFCWSHGIWCWISGYNVFPFPASRICPFDELFQW